MLCYSCAEEWLFYLRILILINQIKSTAIYMPSYHATTAMYVEMLKTAQNLFSAVHENFIL